MTTKDTHVCANGEAPGSSASSGRRITSSDGREWPGRPARPAVGEDCDGVGDSGIVPFHGRANFTQDRHAPGHDRRWRRWIASIGKSDREPSIDSFRTLHRGVGLIPLAGRGKCDGMPDVDIRVILHCRRSLSICICRLEKHIVLPVGFSEVSITLGDQPKRTRASRR
jgi:hypothetical protein